MTVAAVSAQEVSLLTVSEVTKETLKRCGVDSVKTFAGRDRGMEENGTQHRPTTNGNRRRTQCRTILGAALTLLGGALLLPHSLTGAVSFVCTVFGMYLSSSKH